MTVYRITKSKYVHDLTGEGAKKYGGRWNPKGFAAVYSSESRAMAILETLVHLPNIYAHSDFSLSEIYIPDELKIRNIPTNALPFHWQSDEYSPALAKLGLDWILTQTEPLLRVPSVVIPEEFNIIINTQHPNANKIKVIKSRSFKYDSRLQ